MTSSTEETAGQSGLEELVFLARSTHRIELLEQLSDEEQRRRDLQDATGISQPTLGRILSDFEQRRWISNHHNGAYSRTPVGALLAESIGDLLDVFETGTHLSALEPHLPWDRFDFDHTHLATSTITTPSRSDPLGHMRRFDELAATATGVSVFSNVLSCAPADDSPAADREFLRHVDQLVVTSDALQTEFDSAFREWLQERIRGGELSLYSYDGPAVVLLGVFDDTVGIVPIDDTGMPVGLIDADTAPLRGWVEETFADYRRNSTRLTAEDLPS